MVEPSIKASSTGFHRPWGVLLAVAAALLACRAREGDRCVCADDCREGLVCLAAGRVLQAGDCSPAVGTETSPGVCLASDEASQDDDGAGQPEVLMDLGSKRDFNPGPPPDPERETGTGSDTLGTSSEGTSSEGTSSGSGGSSSSGGSTGSGSSSGTTAGT